MGGDLLVKEGVVPLGVQAGVGHNPPPHHITHTPPFPRSVPHPFQGDTCEVGCGIGEGAPPPLFLVPSALEFEPCPSVEPGGVVVVAGLTSPLTPQGLGGWGQWAVL